MFSLISARSFFQSVGYFTENLLGGNVVLAAVIPVVQCKCSNDGDKHGRKFHGILRPEGAFEEFHTQRFKKFK